MRIVVRSSLIGFMALALMLRAGGGMTPSVGPESDGPAGPDPAQVERVKRYVAMLEEARERVSRPDLASEALAKDLGDDPERIFEWVRDNTSVLPYRGVLRGADGVLLDRVGNSLDRALLLHRLLSLAGHKARLVSGQLSEAQADALLSKARPVPPSRSAAADAASLDGIRRGIEAAAEKYDLDARRQLAEFDRVIREQKKLAQKMEASVKEQSGVLARALRDAGLDPSAAQDKEKKRIIRALRDHWWVQIDRGGEWIDLDPTAADAVTGASVIAGSKTWDAGRLASSLYHSVKVRVIVEKWGQGRLQEACALEHSLRPAEILGTEITLSHIPMNAPQPAEWENDKDLAGSMERAALEEKEWWPVLRVGRKDVRRASFTEAGTLNSTPGRKPSSGRSPMGGLLGGLGGRGAGEKEAGDSHLTAAWIDYVVSSPGASPRTYRRQIFDLLGPAKRRQKDFASYEPSDRDREDRAFLLTDKMQISILPSLLSPEFVLDVVQGRLLHNLEAVRDFVESGKGTRVRDLMPLIDGIQTLPGPDSLLALARGMDLSAVQGVSVDSPVIVSFHDYPSFVASRSRPAQGGLDIVANPAAPDPKDPAGMFTKRLNQGLLDSNLEALIMGSLGAGRSTAGLFAGAIKAGEKWAAVRSIEDLKARGLSYPPDLQARIESDLESGSWVVLPEKWKAPAGDASFGWWRLDPGSGAVLGMGDRGWGQAMTQYSKTTESVILSHISNAFCLAGFLRGAGESGGPGKGIEDVLEFMCCLAVNKGTSSFGNIFRFEMARDLSYLFFGYTAGSFLMSPIDICDWF